jgi:hypothetical protein
LINRITSLMEEERVGSPDPEKVIKSREGE